MILDATDALCRQIDPDLWFPEKGGVDMRARALCFECPLQQACLSSELSRMRTAKNSDTHGIWGGTTPDERYRMIRERNVPA